MVNTEQGQSIGVLAKGAAMALSELSDLGQLKLQASSKRSVLQSGLVELEKGVQSPQFTADINVLGPAEVSEAVARILSKYRLYLQAPDTVSELYRYANPQYLELADCLEDTTRELHAQGEDEDSSTRALSDTLQHTADPLALFDALAGSRNLGLAAVDSRIKTTLKR